MRKSLFVLGVAVTAIMSIIVINAQHQDDTRPAQATAVASDAMFVHALCAETHDAPGTTTGHHVPAEIASALELTDAQQTVLDRKAADACAAMTRAHEDMMSVLTPAQQEKMRALHAAHGAGHGAGGANGVHDAVMSWMKKLHGGQ